MINTTKETIIKDPKISRIQFVSLIKKKNNIPAAIRVTEKTLKRMLKKQIIQFLCLSFSSLFAISFSPYVFFNHSLLYQI
jgi:hypothetical protein